MKSLIAIVAAVAVSTALAADPNKKVEEVKKPAQAASVPATPKEMPKVAKPPKKEEKKDEKKDGKK